MLIITVIIYYNIVNFVHSLKLNFMMSLINLCYTLFKYCFRSILIQHLIVLMVGTYIHLIISDLLISHYNIITNSYLLPTLLFYYNFIVTVFCFVLDSFAYSELLNSINTIDEIFPKSNLVRFTII